MNNVVGKILIVLQLVFSLLFMCFAGAVYTFQQSWRTKAVTAQQNVAQRDATINDLKEQHTQELQTRSDAELALKTRADAAEAKLKALTEAVATRDGELAQVQQQRDKFQADLLVAQAEAQSRVDEAVALREEIKKQRDVGATQIAEIRTLEDRNVELNKQVALLKEGELSYENRITNLEKILRANDIDSKQVIAGIVPEEITPVSGKVLGTRPNSSRSAELVQISIGSDDKVRENMELFVYRENKYLAQIRITDVSADSAVGVVVERSRNGVIERGDNVTTKL